ncbi:RusA family crossover junction endodeoxyribonuclease [Bacillus pumilus]|uniref:RusA family crossover junction endodeoxyribonuclease n=1 Tax=Bacillus pumilus TaxID=1408 RepID=UPI0021B1BB57|nr:RusA family crossover junction endodeoxyribonuclease [Bacillus pumilus]
MKESFVIKYDQLPPSVNNYLRPSVRIVDGRPVVHMYETKEAKDFKKRFCAYLKREVKKQDWNVNITKEGHWYLDVVFIQSRTNEDNNNYFKILCDSMKDLCIDDDKNLLVRPQWVMYNAKKPSFKAVLHKVDYIGVFKDKRTHDEFIESNCLGCKRYKRNCSILRKSQEGRVQSEISLQGNSYTCDKRG